MEWEVKWEIASGDTGKTKGIATVEGNRAIDALNNFFKNKENQSRKIIGIVAIYEELKPYRQERVII